MLCQVASSTPAAVARTLRDDRSAQPVLEWLHNIRISIEEYDPLITVRPPTPEEPKPDAFDEILSQLGKEIYKLDEYQRNLVSEEKEVSLSILNIFDEFLDELDDNDSENTEMTDLELSDVNEVKPVNGVSDSESTLSDVSFVTSAPARDVLREVIPIPPRKARLKTPSPKPSYMEIKELPNGMAKRLNSESDSESTCWSYKECSTDGEHDDKSTYAEMWLQSTGYGKSNELLQRIISQNQATISCISFDTVSDFSPAQYSVYSLHEVGDRCDRPVAMTPDGQTDDGYEPVGDAITTDENEYAEIEFGNSYTDEGYSCGSVEAESCSNSASSEYVGRESPFYVNLKDLGAYSVTPDVIFWTKLLQDPYYNEDEEDEWITPEECAVYSREQRPPLVIPRITQYRRDPPPRRQQYVTHGYNDEASKSSVRQYDLQDWPMDRDFERSFATDSPPSGRINRNFVGSTENLRNPVRPNFLQLPASSSGDNLDVEVRERDIGYNRSRKSQSVAVPKNRRSPMPMLLPHNEGQFPEIKREGPVKRTKFSENGKKCRKNWVDCYMILTPTALVFYRDYKTYKASKILRPPGTPSAQAELVLPLQNAHVVECRHHHTRRYTRSLVLTVRHDLYLLQDETEEGAKHWMRCIQEVYFNLGRPDDSKRDELPLQYQSSNTDLESLGRTPPVSRHSNRSHQKAGGSSNEDLSDSTEVSISKVKTTLRNFFVKRPTKDFLVKKGIYQEEPVFGRKLEEVCPATSPRIPDFVVACVREIESNEENMCTDGLYRASGNLSQVQKIRLEVDQNHLTVIESNTDIHVLTGSLKLFFRELKEPLIPCNIFDKVLAACSIKPKEAKIKKFKDIVNALPQCNRDTLKFLLEHLLRVTQYSERNRMSTANLAIVFGPTLLWAPAEQAHNIAIDCIQQNHVVEILLNEFNEIFDDGKGKKKT